MVQYAGKCAAKSCRHTWNHKCFRGRPEGRSIPNPCYIKLERGRPDTDDRICTDCYKKHLAAVPTPLPPPPTTPNPRNSFTPATPSSAERLDGSYWVQPRSDRLEKLVTTLPDGTRVIPVHVHHQKMEEAKLAEREAMVSLMEACQAERDDCEEALQVESIFRRDDLTNEDRANILKRVMEYYKQKPSMERARLLQDLTNQKATALVGVSSKTMAAARRTGPSPPKKNRYVVGEGGYTLEELKQILAEYCMDPRFCEVRSWVSTHGDVQQRHWEAVGIVPAFIMYKEIGKELKDPKWTSLATFYRALPDFYVEKKKERCACNHCKKGRIAIAQAVTMVNGLRRLLRAKKLDTNVLDKVRGDLLDLSGHLEKEIVVQIVGGRHAAGCGICKLPASISSRVALEISKLNRSWMLPFTKEEWSTVFVGEAFPASATERRESVERFFRDLDTVVQRYLEHLLLKADRIMAYELDLAQLKDKRDAEVYLIDYSMSRQTVGSYTETEEQFLDKDNVDELGVLRIYYDPERQCLVKSHYLFLFQGGKDGQTTLQILQRFLKEVTEDRVQKQLPALHEGRFWSDNANDLKGGQIFDEWKKILADGTIDSNLERIVLQYHAKNEGKTILDGFFGVQAGALKKFERSGRERNTVNDMFDVYSKIPTSHVYLVEIDRNEGQFYRTAAGVSDLHSVQIDANEIRAQTDSKSPVIAVVLGDVKARQTKAAKKKREEQEKQAIDAHGISTELCQKCQNGVKKGEDVSGWLQCDECDRSWHKECVGIAADADVGALTFRLCASCGGADPKGDSLSKKRKAPTCPVCNKLKKGHDHSQCKEAKEAAADSFRTPICGVQQQASHPIPDAEFKQPATVRNGRRQRRKRNHKGSIITEEQYEERKRNM